MKTSVPEMSGILWLWSSQNYYSLIINPHQPNPWSYLWTKSRKHCMVKNWMSMRTAVMGYFKIIFCGNPGPMTVTYRNEAPEPVSLRPGPPAKIMLFRRVNFGTTHYIEITPWTCWDLLFSSEGTYYKVNLRLYLVICFIIVVVRGN